jgi:hypothetical protein
VALLLVGVLAGLLATLGGVSGPVDQTQAQAVAEEIVQETFPEFAGQQDRVEKVVAADGSTHYVFSYSYVAETETGGQTLLIPRSLIIDVPEEGDDVFVAYSN